MWATPSPLGIIFNEIIFLVSLLISSANIFSTNSFGDYFFWATPTSLGIIFMRSTNSFSYTSEFSTIIFQLLRMSPTIANFFMQCSIYNILERYKAPWSTPTPLGIFKEFSLEQEIVGSPLSFLNFGGLSPELWIFKCTDYFKESYFSVHQLL